MADHLSPQDALALLEPATTTLGLSYLVSEDAPSRVILAAGAGCYAQTVVAETAGIFLEGADNTPETVAARFAEICKRDTLHDFQCAIEQTRRYAERAINTGSEEK